MMEDNTSDPESLKEWSDAGGNPDSSSRTHFDGDQTQYLIKESCFEKNCLTECIASWPRFVSTLLYAASVLPAVLLFVHLFNFVENAEPPRTWPGNNKSCYDGNGLRNAELLETENGTVCCALVAPCSRQLVDPWVINISENTTLCGFRQEFVLGEDMRHVSYAFQPEDIENQIEGPDITVYAWLHAAVGIFLGVIAMLSNGTRFKAKFLGLLGFIAAEAVEAYFITRNVPTEILSDLYEASSNERSSDSFVLQAHNTVFALLGIYSVTCFDHLLMAVSFCVHCMGYRTAGSLEADAWQVRDYYVFLLLFFSIIMEGGLGALSTTATFFGCNEANLTPAFFFTAMGMAILGCCCCCLVGCRGFNIISETLIEFPYGMDVDEVDSNPFRRIRLALSLMIVEFPGLFLNPAVNDGLGGVFVAMLGYTGAETILDFVISTYFSEGE